MQFRAKQTAPLVNNLYENEIILREENLSLKFCQPLKMLIYFEEGFRAFHELDIGCVGQRTAKLLAVIIGGLRKKSVVQPNLNHMCAARVRFRLGQIHYQSLTDGNFAAL